MRMSIAGSARLVSGGAALLLAGGGIVGGLAVYAALRGDGDGGGEPERAPVPTAAVTYEVEGEGVARIAFLGSGAEGEATVLRGAGLPWEKTVRVPLGRRPTVSVTLPGEGGRASCTVAVRGEHVQRATAFGPHGRATCSGELPERAG